MKLSGRGGDETRAYFILYRAYVWMIIRYASPYPSNGRYIKGWVLPEADLAFAVEEGFTLCIASHSSATRHHHSRLFVMIEYKSQTAS